MICLSSDISLCLNYETMKFWIHLFWILKLWKKSVSVLSLLILIIFYQFQVLMNISKYQILNLLNPLSFQIENISKLIVMLFVELFRFLLKNSVILISFFPENSIVLTIEIIYRLFSSFHISFHVGIVRVA